MLFDRGPATRRCDAAWFGNFIPGNRPYSVVERDSRTPDGDRTGGRLIRSARLPQADCRWRQTRNHQTPPARRSPPGHSRMEKPRAVEAPSLWRESCGPLGQGQTGNSVIFFKKPQRRHLPQERIFLKDDVSHISKQYFSKLRMVVQKTPVMEEAARFTTPKKASK